MKMEKSANKDLYYTKDHEWIDFQGSVAYVGVCSFKLIGIRVIQKIILVEPSGLKKKGDVIATIKYKDYKIDVHMPVDGKLMEVNEILLTGNRNVLLQNPENIGWIALIIPSQPYERIDLLPSKQYQMNGKGKYAK